ncbi:MAG TPA: hypothetical protein VIG33_14440 [Pseudobdellovibrionaceae bacterium]|jgi:hypothetical protein
MKSLQLSPKNGANLTEDQAYRCGKFLQLNNQELDYFLDLVRMDRVADVEVKKYFKSKLEKKSLAAREVKNRVAGSSIEGTLSSQIQYYSSFRRGGDDRDRFLKDGIKFPLKPFAWSCISFPANRDSVPKYFSGRRQS